jgi:Flp pilus assembly protein TadB
VSFALVAVTAALLLLGRSPDRAGRRLADSPANSAQATPASSGISRRPALPALAAATVLGPAAAYSTPAGLVASLALAPLAYVVVRRVERPPAAAPVDRAAVPLVLDLLAAALRTGVPVPVAISVVAAGAPAAIADPLRRTAALLQLGASGPQAWAPLLVSTELAAIGVVAARSADSGIRLADGLGRRADIIRLDIQAQAVVRAQRVGVFALLPLGLCFLPAFVCLGIVPVIAAVAHQVLVGGTP